MSDPHTGRQYFAAEVRDDLRGLGRLWWGLRLAGLLLLAPAVLLTGVPGEIAFWLALISVVTAVVGEPLMRRRRRAHP